MTATATATDSPVSAPVSSDRAALSPASLRVLFDDARTYPAWTPTPVDDALLRRLYELTRLAPTAWNSSPLRVVFVKSAEARARLLPGLAEANRPKVSEAPVTAILAYDSRFYDEMPRLLPMRDMRGYLAGLPDADRDQKVRQNANLQAGFFIAAARALGLDAGPMGGFDAAAVDAAFFADGHWKSLLLVNLGHGDAARLHPRLPRLSFEEAARIE